MPKRYETMTVKDILELLSMCKYRDNCGGCIAEKYTAHESQAGCIAKYLNAEIEMKPRWQTAKTQEDFDKLREDFLAYCPKANNKTLNCDSCKYSGILSGCYHAYLSELVEVQE